jgi:hypothetical protein
LSALARLQRHLHSQRILPGIEATLQDKLISVLREAQDLGLSGDDLVKTTRARADEIKADEVRISAMPKPEPILDWMQECVEEQMEECGCSQCQQKALRKIAA